MVQASKVVKSSRRLHLVAPLWHVARCSISNGRFHFFFKQVASVRRISRFISAGWNNLGRIIVLFLSKIEVNSTLFKKLFLIEACICFSNYYELIWTRKSGHNVCEIITITTKNVSNETTILIKRMYDLSNNRKKSLLWKLQFHLCPKKITRNWY